MRSLILVSGIAVLAACTSSGGLPVDCERHLIPINAVSGETGVSRQTIERPGESAGEQSDEQ